MKASLFPILFGAMLLTGCGSTSSPAVSSSPVPTSTIITPSDSTPPVPSSLVSMNAALQKPLPSANDEIAVITTNKGKIALRFFNEEAPKAVENFLGLAKKGYYNGVIFHRVIDKFMIQGGDPTGTGRGGESIFGKVFENEISPKVKNLRGSLAMANAGANTNGSQFYINQNDNLFLDGGYTVFGEVIDGMSVVDAIATSKTDAADKPIEPITMEKVEVMKYAEYQK